MSETNENDIVIKPPDKPPGNPYPAATGDQSPESDGGQADTAVTPDLTTAG